MEILRRDGSGIVYGVDIPFWFDEGENPYDVMYRSVRKNVVTHLLEIVDNIGIMDYRNFASGMDGIVWHGAGEIEAANKLGKKVYIGVETYRDPPTKVSFIYGLPADDWSSISRKGGPSVLRSMIDGYKILPLTIGDRKSFGVSQPEVFKNRDAFDQVLVSLYKDFGATSGRRSADLKSLRYEAESFIEKQPDYKGFEEFVIKDKGGKVEAAGFATTAYMIDKITFDGMTKKQLDTVLKEVAESYEGMPSFVGFAIHHYTTYKKMKGE
jgi:hypothetical protein